MQYCNALPVFMPAPHFSEKPEKLWKAAFAPMLNLAVKISEPLYKLITFNPFIHTHKN